MRRKPNFSNGDMVKYQGKVGQIKKTWLIKESDYKYTVQFADGKQVIEEGKLSRA